MHYFFHVFKQALAGLRVLRALRGERDVFSRKVAKPQRGQSHRGHREHRGAEFPGARPCLRQASVAGLDKRAVKAYNVPCWKGLPNFRP